jgi:glycosyltransferase involved in cell wall biosynthesis
MKKRLDIPINNFVIGFVGALKEWIDLVTTFDAIKELANRYANIKVMFVGGEGSLEGAKILTRKYGLEEKAIFTGAVPYEEVPYYISSFDVCLIPFKLNRIGNHALPLKLFEYMACGRPVISSGLPEVHRAVGKKVFIFYRAEELYKALELLINNRSLKKKWEKKGENLLNNIWMGQDFPKTGRDISRMPLCKSLIASRCY